MIEQKVNTWMEGIKSELINSYKQRGLRASGQWERDLEPVTTRTATNVNTKMLGSASTGVMITGRKPNTNQNKDALRKFVGWAGSTFLAEWVRNKGVKISPFAVAYKIARQGVTVPNSYNDGNLLSSVVTEQRIRELSKTVGEDLLANFKSDFIKIMKNGN